MAEEAAVKETGATTETSGESVFDAVTNADSAETGSPDVSTEQQNESAESSGDQPGRPPWLPEKFKTPEALVESYRNLERKLTELTQNQNKVPEQYEVVVPEGLEIPPELFEQFKEAGFTNEQAQAAVDSFVQFVVPAVQQAQAEAIMSKLEADWGVDRATVVERLTRLKQWAETVFEPTIVHMLGRSVEGVKFLEMTYNRFGSRTAAAPAKAGELTEDDIEVLVSDPRYGHDPVYTRYVDKQIGILD